MTRQLIEKIRNDNVKAQFEFYRIYSVRLFNVAYRYVLNEQDVESVVNMGFYKVFNNIGRFVYSNEAGLVAWMKKIVINEALCFLRQNASFEELDDKIAANNEFVIDPELNIGYDDCLVYLRNLPDDLRTVFNLYAIDGYSHKEIADQLNIKESSSRVYLTRARKILQGFLTK